jgi:hypothetical protein
MHRHEVSLKQRVFNVCTGQKGFISSLPNSIGEDAKTYAHVHFDGLIGETNVPVIQLKALPAPDYVKTIMELSPDYCTLCSAAVLNTQVHTKWHEDLAVSIWQR